jgi:sortase A
MSDNFSRDNHYQTEIHRLLRIGDNIVVPKNESKPAAKPTTKETMSFSSLVFEYTGAAIERLKRSRYSGLMVYPMIFLGSFLFFYIILNFPSFVSQVQGFASTKTQDEQILEDKLPAYYAWIGGYFFSVGDKGLLGPTSDIDKDGLSNMDEFIIRTNPTISDSDSDGISDGIEVINQTNPWGSGGMTKQQFKLAEDLDLIMINNRISFNTAFNNQQVQEHSQNFDLSRPGRLSIPKLGLQVPLIFSESPDNFDHDLTRGVIHYPGTALPGEKGTVYVSGHSSDYLWKKHPYKQVFAKLNFLEPGDDIFVDVYGLDGKLYNFRYKVFEEKIYAPDDQTQFIDNTQAKLNLSTCWPIGTQKDRYIVSALLENL